jgi:hypothetical protein
MEVTKKLSREDSHLTEEGVALYVDALKLKTTDRLPDRVREHVASCLRCKQEIVELESLVDEDSYRGLRSHPAFGVLERGDRVRYLYRIAAAILVMLGVGAVVYLSGLFGWNRPAPEPTAKQIEVGHGGTDTARAAMKTDSGTIVERRGALAANFEPSPNLEGVVNSSMRSADVSVLSPAGGEVVRGNVSFRWRTDIRPPYTLKILNNHEVEKARLSLSEQGYVWKKKLADGLYYWKLEAGGELLVVGKFVIKNLSEGR